MHAMGRSLFLTPLLVLALVTSSHAATLYTPPLSWSLIAGSLAFRCEIVNVASGPREVRAQVITDAATTVADSGVVLLAPNGTLTQDYTTFGGDRTYCRFDVQGGRKKFRASACTYSVSDEGCVASVNAK